MKLQEFECVTSRSKTEKMNAIPGRNYILLIVFFISISFASAQTEIPMGTWRLHLSYNAIRSIALGSEEIYGAAESGVLVINREDNSISSYNTLNGLSGTDITCIAYDDNNHQLFVAYADGNLDIITDKEVRNFNRLKNATEINGSKRINHISFHNNFAYLSSDFGVVVFEQKEGELKEIWRDLNDGGGMLKINESVLSNDSIFLATEKGIIAGSLNQNLLYFANWRRFDSSDLNNSVQSIVSFNNEIFSAISGLGIYRYLNGKWMKQNFFSDANLRSLAVSENFLYVIEGQNLWRVDRNGNIQSIQSDWSSSPLDVAVGPDDKIYVGDASNGLVSNFTGAFSVYLPDGPVHADVKRLAFRNNKLFALTGKSSHPNTGVDFFSDGQWEILPTTIPDITDVETIDDQLYLASYGRGVEQSSTQNGVVFDESNSTLTNTDPLEESVNITALAKFQDELWVTNYGADIPLHSFKMNTWQSHPIAFQSARFITDMVIDFSGNVWMLIDPAMGGGVAVYIRRDGNIVMKTETTGSGGLPSNNVHSICVDRDGYVWAGTDQGVAYFFSPNEDAIKPIFENRFLLRDEKITTIEIDGGNRKWMGTERGVWVFNPIGEELIYNFNTENSPLLSNNIYDIEINRISGEVFFATQKGIISYRADASGSTSQFDAIRIFPNPVTSAFAGTVGIAGLSTDAIVKITDISGKLIWQTQANGGTATWNVRDYNGRRVATGVYLVFAVSSDGSDSVVGKIAVVD